MKHTPPSLDLVFLVALMTLVTGFWLMVSETLPRAVVAVAPPASMGFVGGMSGALIFLSIARGAWGLARIALLAAMFFWAFLGAVVALDGQITHFLAVCGVLTLGSAWAYLRAVLYDPRYRVYNPPPHRTDFLIPPPRDDEPYTGVTKRLN